ncbi:MAG TPA: transglutaminase-like domain-containing protein [Mycobacteriales bacterium]|nr:transglutaminase-like domain-containing protein [Mycobacteriales bacterium]
MTASSRAQFAAVVREEPVDTALACLLVGCEVEPDLSLDASYAALDRLAGGVRLASRSPVDVARALQRALGQEAGFGGREGDYDDLRSSLLHEVLRRGRGLPITLSVVWREVATRLGVPAVCLGLPGHVMVRLGAADGDHVVVDPFHGGVERSVDPDPVLEGADLVLRVLTNVRALSARSFESARTRLWATELSLLLPRHPLELRRERGELLVRLGAYEAGAEELEAYAAVVPDEAVAEQVRRSARLSRARLN